MAIERDIANFRTDRDRLKMDAITKLTAEVDTLDTALFRLAIDLDNDMMRAKKAPDDVRAEWEDVARKKFDARSKVLMDAHVCNVEAVGRNYTEALKNVLSRYKHLFEG